MKITFLARSLNYGGAERQLVALAKGLHERGHSIIVLVFYPDGPLESDLHDAGISLQSLNKQGRWDIFSFFLHLIQFIREEKPDIILAFLGIPNIFTVLLKPIFPQIHMVWGVYASNVDLTRYDWLTRLSYKIECKLSRFADLIIVNSYAGLKYAIAHGFFHNKMVVIPNGFDTAHFYPDIKLREKIRLEWSISENKKLIGLVGRFDPMKDHPTFLKAAALMLKEQNDVYFVCIGDGPTDYQQELESLAKELRITRHLNWVSARKDMPAVFNALDIATSSSYGEGLPNVIGEAMACGVPCVVTDVGDSALIVGDTGIVVPPKSPEKLAQGWKILLKELNDNISTIKIKIKNRNRIISEYSNEVFVQRTSEVLEGIVNRNS